MKKFIITSILSSLICVASFGQSLYRTILSHYDSSTGQTTLTQYDITHWTDAISNAVEGDTVYFTPGLFNSGFTINKPITLIGAGVAQSDLWCANETSGIQNALADCGISGQSTRIGGTITIDYEGTLTETMLEGFLVNGGLSINKSVTGLSVKRCHFGEDIRGADGVTVTNLTLESLRFRNLNCGHFVNPDIHNCYFETLNGQEDPIALRNCSFSQVEAAGFTFLNCIDGDNYMYQNGNVYKNCIYETNAEGDGSTYENCHQYEDGWNLTKTELQTANYLGDDNTVIGPLGGTTPFTLIPSQPYVSSSSVTYDAGEKKLNVNITVKKGK